MSKLGILIKKWMICVIGCLMLLSSFISCVEVNLVEKLNTKVRIKLPSLSNDYFNSYTIEINGEKVIIGPEGDLPELFPGIYPALIYSNTPALEIVDGVVQVNLINGQLNSFPELFFSISKDLKIDGSTFDYPVIEIDLEQQIRLLEMRITPPIGGVYDHISTIEGKLTGVAGKWDLKNNVAIGPALEVPVKFIKQVDGTWLAQLRLLGVLGSKQELIADIQFLDRDSQDLLKVSNLQANQGGQSLTIISDLTNKFQDFNIEKSVPFILSGAIELPKESGFIVSVNDWERVHETGVAW